LATFYSLDNPEQKKVKILEQTILTKEDFPYPIHNRSSKMRILNFLQPWVIIQADTTCPSAFPVRTGTRANEIVKSQGNPLNPK
jgi:hypothetical protein